MSTPTDGYFDEQGNFIPGSFADQLDMPAAGGTDDAAAAKAQAEVNKQKGIAASAMTTYQLQGRLSRVAMATYKQQKSVADAAMAAYNRKGATAAQKKAATIKRNLALAEMKRQTTLRNNYLAGQKKQTTTRNTALAAQQAAQNKYYEATGQYEKLLTGDQRDAYAALRSLFNGYGLGSLAGKIYDYAKQGYGADVISLLLQDTKEYKERFAGNTERAKNGLPVLSPAEYLSTEQAYRQILSDAGLPKGFYDSPTDFKNWIAGDVSPTEIKGRVDVAVATTAQYSQQAKTALQQLYGVDNANLVAYALDRKTALPILQKQAAAAQFGGEALKRGLTLDKGDLEDFVNAGLSLSQVSSGFQAVAEALPNIQAIAARYGEAPFGQSELERDIVGGQAGNLGETRRKRLASQERALFSGSSGASPGGLAAYNQNT